LFTVVVLNVKISSANSLNQSWSNKK
jgi:hypothetical protein